MANNPFSHGESFCSELSIDYVKIFISVLTANSTTVENLLRSMGCPSGLIKNMKGPFVFICNAEEFNVYFRKVFINGHYQGYSIKIFSPNHLILCRLDNMFSGLYSVGDIEFSADLYSNKPGELFCLIKNTMTVMWPGSVFKHSFGTYYANNIRKNRSKGAKAYVKDVGGDVVVRLEVTLKRRRTKKTLYASSLTTLNQIKADDIFKIC